jgi:dimethylglycine dehydrogenase
MAANKMPVKAGGMRLTHFLTTLGGIEAEMTVTKLADDRYYLNSGITSEFHDRDWLVQHVADGEEVIVSDVTEETGILAVAGPKSREILAGLTDADLTNESFRWLTGQEIEVAGVPCIALRVSYVGELGWELHCPMDQMQVLYDAIVAVGEPLGMVHYGAYAMNCMRIEKAYKAMGSELTTEITPVEADLGRFVNYDNDFQGKEATEERLALGDDIETILVYCSVECTDNDPRGNEPVYCNGEQVGLTTSGTFGHSVGTSLAFAFVDPECQAPGTELEILMMGERRPATILSDAAYDAANEKPRA